MYGGTNWIGNFSLRKNDFCKTKIKNKDVQRDNNR